MAYSTRGWYTAVDDAWPAWVTSTATTTSSNDVWRAWSSTSSTALTNTSTGNVWLTWQTDPYRQPYRYVANTSTNRMRHCPHNVEYNAAVEQAAHQCEQCQADVDRRTRLANQLDRGRRRRLELAELRATELLMQHLDEEQQAEFNRDRQFHVVCPRTGRRFKIRRQWSGNLDEYGKEGKITQRHCVHHQGCSTAVEDNMLTQKMMIEAGLTDELVRLANTTRVG